MTSSNAPTVNSPTDVVSREHDWEAECRGLGYMILTIANRYEAARTAKRPTWWSRRKWRLGGDDELLWSAVTQAKAWVDGPLRERLGPIHSQHPGTSDG